MGPTGLWRSFANDTPEGRSAAKSLSGCDRTFHSFRLTLGTLALLLSVSAIQGLAHELPTFPRIRLLSVLEHPWEPGSRILTIEVLDPGGREPVVGAQVLVSAIEKERGSAVRLRGRWLAPTPQPGIYQGRVEFPARGVWALTVAVRGKYVGEAHFEIRVGGDLPEVVSESSQPELYLGWQGWRLLVLDWGHLLGFGLWLGVTVLALFTPRLSLRGTVVLTWVALVIGVGTGFNKMEYGTPFARGLSLFNWEVPRIFFGKEYIYTLTAKHLLIVGAFVVTAVLTRQTWRGNPSRTAISRTLLLVNLLIALAIGGAAAMLELLHAIVLHFA